MHNKMLYISLLFLVNILPVKELEIEDSPATALLECNSLDSALLGLWANYRLIQVSVKPGQKLTGPNILEEGCTMYEGDSIQSSKLSIYDNISVQKGKRIYRLLILGTAEGRFFLTVDEAAQKQILENLKKGL